MNIRHLQFVIAIAEYGNFSKTAEILHVSQPSLSHAIANLELTLGITLFNRAGKKVTLTSVGVTFVECARAVLHDIDILHESIKAVNKLEYGHLDIAAPQSTAACLLPRLVGRYRSKYPSISIRIHTSDNTHDIERLVRTGKCELALTVVEPAPPLLNRILGRQIHYAIFPPDTMIKEKTLDHCFFSGKPLVVPSEIFKILGGFSFDIPDDMEQPFLAVETDSRQALIPLVLSGAGITILPKGLADEAEKLGCVIREISPPITQDIRLITRQCPLSPAANEFIALIDNIGDDMLAQMLLE